MVKTTTVDQQSTHKTTELQHNVISSGLTTVLVHPFRVFLNQASKYQWPHTTVINGTPFLFKGIGINFARGSVATGLQSQTKNIVQHKWGLLSGVTAAACCGAVVATCMETPLIRKTMALNAPLWRLNPTLFSLYLIREWGFSLTVLAKQDLSPWAQTGTLYSMAWVTAAVHKLVVIEASRDLQKHVTAPDFRQGIGFTIMSMARGGVYTHPAFQAPFKNPANIPAMIGNLLHVSCGVNMYVFRLLYLAAFGEVLQRTSENLPSITNSIVGFFNKPKPIIPLKKEQDKEPPENSASLSL